MAVQILNIRNLHKSFGTKRVIDGVDMHLMENEHLVVLGRSGTGKSVIMKCIIGLMEPDQGEITVFDTNINSCSEKELNSVRTRVGYLFQEGAMYDSMTVRENLLFPVKRHSEFRKKPLAELNDIAATNLERVGLIDAIDKYPSELSGGMKKRAGLARTLMLSPELIIYDEPTTGLDPYTTESINDLIMMVKEVYNTSAIIITHDIKCAKRTSDRIIMLNEGKVLAEGTYDQLSADPLDQVRLFFN